VTAGPTNTQYGHDGLGRVNSSTQTTNGTTYPTLYYGYNLVDEMTSETYPSGRMVTTNYDSAGRPNGVIGSASGGQTNYVSGMQYAAQGAPKQMTGGDQVTRTWTYNTRFQTAGIVAANGTGHRRARRADAHGAP